MPCRDEARLPLIKENDTFFSSALTSHFFVFSSSLLSLSLPQTFAHSYPLPRLDEAGVAALHVAVRER